MGHGVCRSGGKGMAYVKERVESLLHWRHAMQVTTTCSTMIGRLCVTYIAVSLGKE